MQPTTSFYWKTKGSSIRSTLHTVVPVTTLDWTGQAFGSFAAHNWTLTPQAGGTLVRVWESVEGWLARLLSAFFQQGLTTSITK